MGGWIIIDFYSVPTYKIKQAYIMTVHITYFAEKVSEKQTTVLIGSMYYYHTYFFPLFFYMFFPYWRKVIYGTNWFLKNSYYRLLVEDTYDHYGFLIDNFLFTGHSNRGSGGALNIYQYYLFGRTEPSRLQSLALQLSDKIGQLVENNERLLEQRGQVIQYFPLTHPP